MAAKAMLNSGVLFTDRRNFYPRPNVTSELWTDVAPFLTVAASRGIETTPDPDYKFFAHRSGWVKQQFVSNAATTWAATGAYTDTVTALAVDGIVGLPSTVQDSWEGLQVEIWNSDQSVYKGQGIIHDAASTSTLSITSLGNPRAVDNLCLALAENDIFVVIGNAFGEGTEAPEADSDELEVVYNSTQILKTAVEITGTLYHSALRGYSKELERLRLEKFKTHKIQKERAFLFGTRVGGTGMTDLANDNTGAADSFSAALTISSKTVRTTMGIVSAIKRYGTSTGDAQNLFTIDATSYKYSNFVDDMEKVFQYIPESGSKRAFCGYGALSYWSKVDAESGFVKKSGFQVQLDSMQRDSLGFNFRRLVTPHGELQLIPTPILRGAYRNSMLIVEDEDLHYMQYRPMVYQTNVKTDNAYDGVKDNIMSDEGIGMTLIEKASWWEIINV